MPQDRNEDHQHVAQKTIQLTGAEASQYLADTFGLVLTPGTLAKYRCVGGGPQFYPNNGRPRYAPAFLDEFARERLGDPVRSTSEYRNRKPRLHGAVEQQAGSENPPEPERSLWQVSESASP